MRHITPAFTALATALAVLACPHRALSQAVSVQFTGQPTDPSVCDGVVYLGSDNGKLYAIKASDGTAVPGFPVDITAAVGDGSTPDAYTRPGVYYGKLGKAIYAQTSRNGVVKLWPDGSIAWINKLDGALGYGGNCTPAVTTEGEVIAEMITKDNVFIVKLKDSDGTLLMTSPPLAQGTYTTISPPAVVGGNIYTTLYPYPAADVNNVTVLNLSDLTVKASFRGAGAEEAPPYVRGSGVFCGGGGIGAYVFKLNSVTLNPDPLFGAGTKNDPGVTQVLDQSGFGTAAVCASPTSADRDPGGTIYASMGGIRLARIVAIDAVSGQVRVIASSGARGALGMVVGSRNVIAFGVETTLNLISVDGFILKAYPLPYYPGRPCYDPTTNRFFVATWPDSTGKSYLLGFDSP